MPQTRYAHDGGPEAPARTCASHAAGVIAADVAGDVTRLLDAFADAEPSTRAVLLMAMERLRPDVVEDIGRSDHAAAPAALLWLATRERDSLREPTRAELWERARALDPQGHSPYTALFQVETRARAKLERTRRRHRRFEPWLVRHAHAVVAFALRESYAWHANVREELQPAILADPDDALQQMRRRLPCVAGREHNDRVRMASLVPSAASHEVLRDVLDWPDFEMQADAAVALAEVGTGADVPALQRLAREHWSAPVRARAAWAAAKLAGRPAGDRPQDDFRDHGVAACAPGVDEPWRVRWRGAERTIELRPAAKRQPTTDAPRIRVESEIGVLVLPDNATAAARLDPWWIYGAHLGEFGGGLFVVGPDGDHTQLRQDPVAEVVRTRRGLVARVGLFRPSLVLLERDGTAGVRARHIVKLPGPAVGGIIEDPDGTLFVPTRLGVMAIDPAGTVSLPPCP